MSASNTKRCPAAPIRPRSRSAGRRLRLAAATTAALIAVLVAWLAPSGAASDPTGKWRAALPASTRPTPRVDTTPAAPASTATEQLDRAADIFSLRNERSRPTAIYLWGDSLAAEAATAFRDALSDRDDVTIGGRVWPGDAICDDALLIAAASAQYAVDVAVLEFSGNAYTPCMTDPATGEGFTGEAWLEHYESDVLWSVQVLGEAGAAVVLAGAPPARPDSPHEDRSRIVDLYREVASRYDHVIFADTGAVLTDNGRYTDTLPCLPFENVAHGCIDGRIQVRHDDGLHVGLGNADVWSSGSYRYGLALADAALAAIPR